MAMSGEFDALLRQELNRNRSQRGEDPNQRARDFAARQMNARSGGPQSTAWAEANRAPIVRDNPQDSPGLPQQAPMPTSNPMNAAIDEQMAAEAGQRDHTGDAGVMEAMQGQPQPQTQVAAAPPQDMGDASVMEQAIASQMGDSEPAEAAAGVVDNEGAEAAGPAQSSNLPSGGAIATAIAAFGGLEGARRIVKLYQSGDPNATKALTLSGVDPDVFSELIDGTGNMRDGPVAGGKYPEQGTKPSASKPAAKKTDSSAAKSKDTKPSSGSKVKEANSPPHPAWESGKPHVRPKVKVK